MQARTLTYTHMHTHAFTKARAHKHKQHIHRQMVQARMHRPAGYRTPKGSGAGRMNTKLEGLHRRSVVGPIGVLHAHPHLNDNSGHIPHAVCYVLNPTALIWSGWLAGHTDTAGRLLPYTACAWMDAGGVGANITHGLGNPVSQPALSCLAHGCPMVLPAVKST